MPNSEYCLHVRKRTPERLLLLSALLFASRATCANETSYPFTEAISGPASIGIRLSFLSLAGPGLFSIVTIPVAADTSQFQAAIANLRRLPRQEQLALLKRLRSRDVNPAVTVDGLLTFLRDADASVDDDVIAAALDVLRALGPRAAEARESLVDLISYESPLLADRDKLEAVRLRSYVFATIADIGVSPRAVPYIVDVVANVDDRSSPREVGAAVRAAAALGKAGRPIDSLLARLCYEHFAEDEFCLAHYGPRFVPAEATTVQLEVMAALEKLGPASDDDDSVQLILREIATSKLGNSPVDTRVVKAAQSVLTSWRAEPRIAIECERNLGGP